MLNRPFAIAEHLRAVLVLAGTVAVLWLSTEALLYRSGLYFHLVEPESNTGAVINALLLLDREYAHGAKNVLVLGDSRVGEGVSPRLVEAEATDVNVVNVAIPGSTPRTWYYFLREVLQRGYRPHAVVIGQVYEVRPVGDIADWALDPAHAAPLVGLGDVASFPRSFSTDAMRERARDAILFPALAMRHDTRHALRAPLERWRKLTVYRPGLLGAIPGYAGNGGRMPQIAISAYGEVLNWGDSNDSQRAQVETLRRQFQTLLVPSEVEAHRAYRADWFARLALLMKQNASSLWLFPLPRGPYTELLHPPLELDLGVMSQAIGLQAMPHDFSVALERPEFFFDELHLNAAGRERLSAALGVALHAQFAADER